MRRKDLRAAATATLVLGLTLGLSACADTSAEAQLFAPGDNDFAASDGFQTREFSPDERDEPVRFSGSTDDGALITSEDYAGRVLVVNFWYAGCAPCRAEAEHLQPAYGSFEGGDVAFLGINTRDSAATSRAFSEDLGVSYPSALAVDDGALKLAFSAHIPLAATPTTLVLDREGRVAARIIGAVNEASASSFEAIIAQVLSEG